MDGGLSAGGPLEVCQGHLLQPHVLFGGCGRTLVTFKTETEDKPKFK